MRGFSLILAILIVSGTNVFPADNPYIHEGSIGTQKSIKKPTKIDPSSFRPIESWVGERFIFLPKTKSSPQTLYLDFWSGVMEHGMKQYLPYEKYVGRIAKVLTVNKGQSDDWNLTLQMVDDNQVIEARSLINDTLSDVAPLMDIEDARTKWQGKPLWYKSTIISTYNAEKDEFKVIELKKYSQVRVVDIVAGWRSEEPVRFILRAPSGEEGFEDVYWSGTNVYDRQKSYSKSFEESFFAQDPRKIYKWSKKIWSAIEDEEVFLGMTIEQARLSWGKPMQINRTISHSRKHEQWVYGGRRYLYFENGLLTAIQD